MTSYLGRGLDAPATHKLGYFWHMERAEIRRHLVARGWTLNSPEIEFRISRIQERIHRNRQTMRERQEAWKARQLKPTGENLFLTFEEIERLAELFVGANDPITASIGAKAAAKIEGRSS